MGDPGAQATMPAAGAPAFAAVGDVGIPLRDAPALVSEMARGLRGAPDAPVLVLGDLFYRDGLLGLCAEGGPLERSRRGCAAPTSPGRQLEQVFGPYRDGMRGRALLGLAGNHDHYGDPVATSNACDLLPRFAPRWRYLSRGCGLDRSEPVATLDLGDVIVFVVDSEEMIRDAAFRRASARSLRDAVRRARIERPRAWRVLATHHPIESYGLHNGAHPLTALRKDLYWLSWTALLPLSWVVDRTLLRRSGQQDVYEWRYRGYRRTLYRALRDAPVDLVVSGHDHSLQLIRIDHPGAPYQLVSGAGAYRTPVKRRGLDLLLANRLGRAVGLAEVIPSHAQRLVFGAGSAAGPGYALVIAEAERLVVEIHLPFSGASPFRYAVPRVVRAQLS